MLRNPGKALALETDSRLRAPGATPKPDLAASETRRRPARNLTKF